VSSNLTASAKILRKSLFIKALLFYHKATIK